jgi:hypothetical protein
LHKLDSSLCQKGENKNVIPDPHPTSPKTVHITGTQHCSFLVTLIPYLLAGGLLPGGSPEGFRGCSAYRSGEDSHREHGPQEDANAQHKQEKNLPTKDRA